jgi:hypothetical protein
MPVVLKADDACHFVAAAEPSRGLPLRLAGRAGFARSRIGTRAAKE